MNSKVGRIELITGPMFAGKTTELLRRIERSELARLNCAVLKYARDDRYSTDNVATHDRKFHAAIPCNELMTHVSECLAYDVIGIDEGQFFPDLLEFADTLTAEGKTIIVAGLDGTFQRQPFGKILNLIAKCESITKLSAICQKTGNEAYFTQRTIESQELEVIGGAEMYSAVSRSTFFGREIKGEVHVTMGPVQSGKTTELLRILNRHRIANRRVVVIAPPERVKAPVTYSVMGVNKLPDLDDLQDYDVIGVDSAETFTGIAEWADSLANSGKLVEVSGLDGDPQGQAFTGMMQLISICEKVQKLDSVCPMTGLPAPFSVLRDGAIIPISRSGLLLQQRLERAIVGRAV